MSDYDLPDLPSDEDLGITEEDREKFEEELSPERPEMSEKEMVALLGETFAPKKEGGDAAGEPEGRAARKERKKREKAEKKRKKELQKQATAKGSAEGSAEAAPPRPAEGPRSRWRGPVTLVALLALAAFSSTRTGLPRPVPANASDTVFSSSRAMSMLIEIARAPHPTGSPEHTRVRDYLQDRLRSLGLEPVVQTAPAMIRGPLGARAATVRNILARIPGTASTGAVVVTAHYDSRELSPGAGDDGAGVVAIVEAVRALLAGQPLRNDVIVLLTDAEELGLLGARAFVDQHPWLDDIRIVLSFEARGSAGPSIMFETAEENGMVVRALRDFDPHPFANSLSGAVYRRLPNDTDFTPFVEAGKQGLNFGVLDNAHVYHQPLDVPENLSESTLQHHGFRALSGMRHFGRADLTTVEAPDVVYFSVPLLGLVLYPGSWVLPIGGGLLILLLVGGLSARRAGARIGAVGVGAVLALAGAGLSFGAAVGLTRWVPAYHPEAGSISGSQYHSEGWYVLALAAGVFVIVTSIHGLARRWLSEVELSLGAVLPGVLLAIALTVLEPMGAMNLQWPAAAGLLSCIVLGLLGTRVSGTVGWIAALLLAVPVVVLLLPVVELLWLAMSIRLAGPLAALMAVTLYLALPAVEGLRHPNAWWAPVAGTVTAAAALGLGVLAAASDQEHPAPSTLVYAYEHGSGTAYWATSAGGDAELDATATAWAVEKTGSDFTQTRDLSPFGYIEGETPVTEAPVVGATPPRVVVLTDTIEGPVRNVRLGVRSEVGAELLRFDLDPGTRTRLLSINGQDIVRPDSLVGVEHWGVPDSLVVLELRMPAAEAIGLHVIEHLLRPSELLGNTVFDRPDGLAPDVSAMSDRALLRFSVAAFSDPRHALIPLRDPDGSPESPGPDVAAPEAAPDSVPDAASDSVPATPVDTLSATTGDTTRVAPPR